MTDLFKEIEKEVKSDKLMSLLKTYYIYIAVIAVLIVAGIIGYNYYSSFKVKSVQDQAKLYQEGITLFQQDILSIKAESKFIELIDKNSGYGLFSNLLLAKKYSSEGNYDKSVIHYVKVIDNLSYPEIYRNYAKYLKLSVEIDNSLISIADQVLISKQHYEQSKDWRPFFGQLYAKTLVSNGQISEASKVLSELLQDSSYPDQLQKIINLQLDSLKF